MKGRRCWIEISRSAIEANLSLAAARLPPGTGIIAVVKANAYGHGIEAVVPVLAGRVAMLAVASFDEAAEVRAIDRQTPILILGPCLPEEREGAVAAGFIPVISNVEEARDYARFGSRSSPVRAHLAIDTGMGRIGVWEEDAAEVCARIAALESLKIEALASHLPCADEDEAFTEAQIARFEALAAALRATVFPETMAATHLLNSAGILRSAVGAGDFVRAGLMLYGISPLDSDGFGLRPAMTWKSRVTLVREIGAGRGISYGRTFISDRPMRVATVAVGYADGYLRALSNRGTEVLIKGRRRAVLGRVTMDQIVVDVSGEHGLPEVSVGDEVVLLGCQGDEEIKAGELARKAGTIPWEIVTSAGNGTRGGRFTSGF